MVESDWVSRGDLLILGPNWSKGRGKPLIAGVLGDKRISDPC